MSWNILLDFSREREREREERVGEKCKRKNRRGRRLHTSYVLQNDIDVRHGSSFKLIHRPNTCFYSILYGNCFLLSKNIRKEWFSDNEDWGKIQSWMKKAGEVLPNEPEMEKPNGPSDAP
jgi:hypothetical protein